MLQRLAIVFLAVQLSANAAEPSIVHPPGPNHGDDPYLVVNDWLKPFAPPGFVWGSHPGLFVESEDQHLHHSARPAAYSRTEARRLHEFLRLRARLERLATGRSASATCVT